MTAIRKAMQSAAGQAGGATYVEDVFSTYLYTGTGAARTITNGIDLSGEGGLVWFKKRNAAVGHQLIDTARGDDNVLGTESTAAESNIAGLTTFTSSGFTLDNGSTRTNNSGDDYASWTLRKAEKFFDVVTWTGDGVTGREIAHNLGSVPAVIITKRYDSSGAWWTVYHKNSPNSVGWLNETNAFDGNDMQYYYGNGSSAVTPTSSVFTVSDSANVNGSAATYVAYLFASDAGGFGDDGDESIIKCGSYTGNGSTDGPVIDCGFEPQLVLVKMSSNTGNWFLMDVMRGMATDGNTTALLPNTNGAEFSTPLLDVNATGFQPRITDDRTNGNGGTYIYIAIRRPMKTPESGTEVYQTDTLGGTLPNPPAYYSGFAADWSLSKRTSASANWFVGTRLTQGSYLRTNTNDAEVDEVGTIVITAFDYSTGVRDQTTVNSGFRGYMFKRATGFFDVVAYSGNPSVAENHNLGVPPELIITKEYAHTWDWYSWGSVLGANKFVTLNSNAAATNYTFNTTVTATTFMAGIASSGQPTIAYLFATLAGVSKVGSYTGTGADLNVDCGFSAGARFILIKRTDSTGDWYTYDSARGIVAGNDPYLLLNTTAAEVTSTDYIDPLSSGFTVTSSAPAGLNASGGTYIFLAIA